MSRLKLIFMTVLGTLSMASTVLLFPVSARAELQTFTTDGCSAFPDHPFIHPDNPQATTWAHCCLAHDFAYWHGGEEWEKRVADDELNRCVSEQTGESTMGPLMWLGVYMGGAPRYAKWESPFPWTWGYGWTEGQGYKALSEPQREEVEKKLIHMYKHFEAYRQQLGLYDKHMEYVGTALYSEIVKFQKPHKIGH